MGFDKSKLSIAKKMSEEIEIKLQGSPREELIKTAVNFLISPRVQQSPTSQKEAFLRKKGLTTEEIRIAFEKSSNHVLPVTQIHHNLVQESSVVHISWFHKFKDILHTVALLVGATYSLYYLYQKFIEPLIFGKRKKPKSLESSINSLNETLQKSIGDLKGDLQKVQCELERVVVMQNEDNMNSRAVNDLKSEIATVKGILLSRHQFSSVNLTGPSIPAWQLTQSSHKDEKESLENEDGEHNSGSSETEIVPNPNSNGGSQGSDSSLEMINDRQLIKSLYIQ
ncbi:hypothetical protein RUM43_014116 [Polyplax serrata]|uniref:Peroxisomal membrane protein PEX14 n=1 Tax=Polyplax serrata TaxID=468196 RepID=A0AAN8P1R8_POLSC